MEGIKKRHGLISIIIGILVFGSTIIPLMKGNPIKSPPTIRPTAFGILTALAAKVKRYDMTNTKINVMIKFNQNVFITN